MKIRDVMTTPVVTIPETATYRQAAQILHDHKISGAPVVTVDGRLIAVISEKDLFRELFPQESTYIDNPESFLDYESRENDIDSIADEPIAVFASKKEVITIGPDVPVLKAGGLLLARSIHRLPVVENGKLIGIVSRRDIFGQILKIHLKY